MSAERPARQRGGAGKPPGGDGNGATGPRTRVVQFSPILPVRDLGRALAHYDSLGFVTHAYAGGDEYGFADRDGIGLHLAADAAHDPADGSAETYLYVEDADALYAEWMRPGIGGVTRPVGDTAYQLREGSHLDPDGNLIRFGSPGSARPDLELLSAHLEAQHGIEVERITELDLGVFSVERSDGPTWVARRFLPSRSTAAVGGDAEVLRFLGEHGFASERCAAPEPVTDLDGHGVLVTEHVASVRPEDRRAAIRDLGGIRFLGELLGRLHTLGEAPGAPARDGGAWHHLADGPPHDEITAVARLLANAEGLVPARQRGLYEALGEEIEALDSGVGLPQALIHPDFVLRNVIASPERGLVLVDWTGAGRGPRLWSLAFFLFAEGAKNLRRVDLAVAGYRRHVDLEPEELSRLAQVARARLVVLESWAFCMGRRSLEKALSGIAEARQTADAVGEQARLAFAREAPA